VAAIRKDLADKTLTVAGLKAMREKELAGRYRVSRDTARKARNDVLSLVEISASTNDK
jgi:DNA-binding GntR family transcriptional regulator